MLDSFLNTMKKGAEKVQRKGEEVAHAARLRMEVFQLNRELDGLYARLGRSFHAGAEVEILQGVREDIKRVEDEIKARERLIQELGGEPDETVIDEQKPEIEQSATSRVTHETPPTTQAASTSTPDNDARHDAQQVQNAAEQAEVMKGHNDPLNK